MEYNKISILWNMFIANICYLYCGYKIGLGQFLSSMSCICYPYGANNENIL